VACVCGFETTIREITFRTRMLHNVFSIFNQNFIAVLFITNNDEKALLDHETLLIISIKCQKNTEIFG
jgi:hypothetical protein